MSEQRKVPKLRFPEFTDDWERRKLGDGMTEYTDRVYIEDSEIYNQVSVKNIGEICLRGQQLGANIGRKRQAKVNLDTHPNTLIFTRQTIEQGGIGFAPEETNGAIVTENMPTIDVNTEIFDKDFFMAFTKTISFRKQVILPNIDGGTAQVAIHEDDVLTSEIEVPSIDEQKKIGEYFSNIDNLITLHQRKCEVLKKLKKGLLQKMFPKDGTNIPEIRFPEFTDAWERRKLGDGMTEYTDRVYIEDSEIYNQVSVKNIGEICLRGQQLGANIGRKRQAKVNLDTHPNTLIFTRQTIEQGGIGFAPEETNGAIVTENMPTIDVNTEIFDKDFFMAFTKTISFRKQVILPNIDGGTAQVAIHEDDVLTSEIEVPSIDEQKKIGEYFSNIDNLITLHQRKLEVLKKLKKGLLQQMFV